jgi:hypothetical protein
MQLEHLGITPAVLVEQGKAPDVGVDRGLDERGRATRQRRASGGLLELLSPRSSHASPPYPCHKRPVGRRLSGGGPIRGPI